MADVPARFGECFSKDCGKLVVCTHLAGVRDNEPDAQNYAKNASNPQAELDRIAGRCPHCNALVIYCSEHDNETARKAFQIVNDLGNIVNGGDDGIVAQAFFMALQRQHRALQQYIGCLIQNTIRSYSKLNENEYDGRNTAFVKFCKELVALSKSGKGPYI